ncbi:MAG: aminotransferase class V-fold PLP-dependent enzyme [Halobacteriales archaeon]
MTPSNRPETIQDLRADIPALDGTSYLNYGAHGPSPRHVVEAAASFLQSHEFEAPATSDPYEHAFEAYERARERIASLLGARPGEVALTESTAGGISAVAGAVDWSPGDVVVRTDLEHPAGVLPWQRLERRGIEVRVVETDEGYVDTGAFAEAVAGADLTCFSATTWTHGTELPVADMVEVAHDAGAFALVDAVQVPGQAPLDVTEWGADAVAAAGHKWLLGPWGGGFLHVDPDAVTDLEPAGIGYRSVETPTADPYELESGARRFEIGSANPAPHVALAEAIETATGIGLDRIEERIGRLTARLADGLPAERLLGPDPPETGLVTIDVDDPAATVERLAGEGIVIRDLPHPDAVRASVHAVNTAEDVDRLIDGLEREW